MNQKYMANFEVTHNGEQYFARVEIGKNGRYSNLPQLKIVAPLSIENGQVNLNYPLAFYPVNGDNFGYDPKNSTARVLAAFELAVERHIMRGIERNGEKSFGGSLVFRACSCPIFQSGSRDGAPARGIVNNYGGVSRQGLGKRLAF